MMAPSHILFHRPTVWSSDIQCSTKVLARLFAEQRYKVTYLESPFDLVHLMRGKGYLSVWRNAPREENGVRIVNPASAVPTRDFWPLNTVQAANARYRLTIPRLPLALKAPDRADMPDLIWTTVPGSATPLRSLFPRAKIVFHVVDFYPAYRGDAVIPLEERDYAVADDIALIGDSLRPHLDRLGVSDKKIHTLGQGVDLSLYRGDLQEHAEIAALPHPRAVWTGALSKGDQSLFETLVAELHKIGGSLVVIGPEAPWIKKIAYSHPRTVLMLGPRKPKEIPALLKQSDVGIMLYDRTRADIYRGQNPLKLYEFAAAGLPILSTPHDVYHQIKPPVRLVQSENEVAPALQDAISDPNAHAKAVAFASSHDWREKVAAIAQRYSLRPAPAAEVLRMTNVAFFSNQFAEKGGHGLARYARELHASLANQNELTIHPIAAWSNLTKGPLEELKHRTGLRLLPLGRRLTPMAWAFADAPTIEQLAPCPVDLVHAVSLGYPISTSKPFVVTVHDLGPLTHPEYFRNTKPWIMERSLRQAERKADLIVCVSQSTANEVEDLLKGSASGRIRVVYEGVGPEFSSGSPDDPCLSGLNLPARDTPVILSAGKISPRKNVGGVVSAFASICHRIPHTLVLVGGKGWDTKETLRSIDKPELSGRVVLLDYVSDEELVALYSRADIYVHPSLYEGFGLTVLEAMASGTPVVTSNCSSLPEVAGDAALLIDPKETTALAEAIESLATDREVHAQMVAKGLERVRLFGWDACADAMKDIYREVA